MKPFDFQEGVADPGAVIDREATSALAQFITVAGIAVIMPFFNNQLLTGPIVNAIFFISVVLFGVNKAIFIALIPSIVSLSVGLLPLLIFPIVPFIIIGNIIQIFVFNIFKKKFWVGVVLASVLKSLFIFTSGTVIFNLILKKDLAPAISLIFSWPQLLAALTGGIIAYLFLKLIKKIK